MWKIKSLATGFFTSHPTLLFSLLASSGSPTSFTDGKRFISERATFHACCTIQDNDLSCRFASTWISFNIDSGKYKLCFRLSLILCCSITRKYNTSPTGKSRKPGSSRQSLMSLQLIKDHIEHANETDQKHRNQDSPYS